VEMTKSSLLASMQCHSTSTYSLSAGGFGLGFATRGARLAFGFAGSLSTLLAAGAAALLARFLATAFGFSLATALSGEALATADSRFTLGFGFAASLPESAAADTGASAALGFLGARGFLAAGASLDALTAGAAEESAVALGGTDFFSGDDTVCAGAAAADALGGAC